MKKFFKSIIASALAAATVFSFTACKTQEKTIVIENLILVEEQYGIAGRKSDEALISKINDALIALRETDYKTVAEKYNLTSELAVTESTVNPLAGASDDSWTKIKNSGKLIIGYTLYAPIAYNDKNGFTGFDTDLAKAVVKYLNQTENANITVDFLEIKWEAKETDLSSGTIDLIWNGLTITDDRKANMCVSVPYLNNNQVAVIRESDKEKYTSAESLASATIGFEKGSAGEDIANELNLGKEKVPFKRQLDDYNQLKAVTVDALVIDSDMANYYVTLNN